MSASICHVGLTSVWLNHRDLFNHYHYTNQSIRGKAWQIVCFVSYNFVQLSTYQTNWVCANGQTTVTCSCRKSQLKLSEHNIRLSFTLMKVNFVRQCLIRCNFWSYKTKITHNILIFLIFQYHVTKNVSYVLLSMYEYIDYLRNFYY